MNGFAFYTQTKPASGSKKDVSMHGHSQNISIKKGVVLYVGLIVASCSAETGTYKFSLISSQNPTYPLSTLNLCSEIEAQKKTNRALNRLEELMQLKDNWDGNGALPIEQAAYQNAKCAIRLIGEKTSDAWNLFPNTNGTLLLTAPGKASASISIGNEEFSFFAMEKGKPIVKGIDTFSVENLTRAFDQIQTVINRV